MTEPRPKPLAWVTGAGGLIGSCFLRLAPEYARAWDVRGLTRTDLDLMDSERVRDAFQRERPQLIIHCAAMTRTPDCQKQPELAHRANVEATVRLAELAAEIPFVFFSTDMVFDGWTGGYTETSPVNPLSVYGETKVAAEQFVLANPFHTVVRTSLNCGNSPTRDRGFNEQLRLAWERGDKLRLFTDEFRCPIPALATAQAVWELVNGQQAGLFHIGGSERLSRYEMGALFAARHPELQPQFDAASAREYPDPPRPRDTSMDCAKAQSVLSFPLPRLSDWLRAHSDETM